MAHAFTQSSYQQVLQAARNGPTLFGRQSNGAVEWLLPGSERSLLYRLVAEVGVRAAELPTLTPADFWLSEDLPVLRLGPLTVPGRRDLHLPLEGAMKAALAEFLQEREDEEPLFQLGSSGCVERVLGFDASQAGLVAGRVTVSSLETLFAVKLGEAECTGKVWGGCAVELKNLRK